MIASHRNIIYGPASAWWWSYRHHIVSNIPHNEHFKCLIFTSLQAGQAGQSVS